MRHLSRLVLPVLSILALTSPAIPATYYVAPEGSDENPGTRAEAPLNTFDHAIQQFSAGDPLILKDGTYTVNNSGRFFARGGNNAANGTAEQPITVKAAHERRAWVKGDGRYAFRLQDVKHWTIDGLRVSSADNDSDTVVRGDPFLAIDVEHLVARRLLAHHNNRYTNSGGVSITQSQNVLVEECELYYFHRNGFSAFQSEDVTFRRCYANSRQHADLPDGRGSHRIARGGGDSSYVAYYSNDVTIENSVSENHNEGFSAVTGRNTVAGNPSGNNFKVLGSISRNDYKPGALQSRMKKKPIGTGEYQPLHNARFENMLVIGVITKGFTIRAVKDAVFENLTIINGNGKQAFNLHTDYQAIPEGNPRTFWPSDEKLGGSEYRLRNWLIINQNGTVFTGVEANSETMDFQLAYANLVDSSLGDVSREQVAHLMREPAKGIGFDQGESVVFIPERSNMSGAGKNGADLGANIVYRYHNGELTDQLLWNPETGAFPHGAVIEGINDVPGKSLFDLHERLNVNPEALPKATSSHR